MEIRKKADSYGLSLCPLSTHRSVILCFMWNSENEVHVFWSNRSTHSRAHVKLEQSRHVVDVLEFDVSASHEKLHFTEFLKSEDRRGLFYVDEKSRGKRRHEVNKDVSLVLSTRSSIILVFEPHGGASI